MLSRVADNLYWMSRYFERSDHCARVIEAAYTLLLNPSKPSREQRWNRIARSLGLDLDFAPVPPNIAHLVAQQGNSSSLVSSITVARENASQVREQISSEMWERLNQLYHQLMSISAGHHREEQPIRVLAAFREGIYKFHGVTEATMNHGEGWYFIQVGKYMERATGVSRLLDAHFSGPADADDTDWVGLLSSCSAFEAYQKSNSSELSDKRVAEFLLLNAEFPYTIRYAADRIRSALNSISDVSSARKTAHMDRIIGRLRSSLAYAAIDEIMERGVNAFLQSVLEQCGGLHQAIHELFIDYPVETAIEF